jgi:hypothetical protein
LTSAKGLEANYKKALVFCHSLNKVNFDFLRTLPIELKVVWLGFGKDYHQYIYRVYEDQLLKQTRKLYRSLKFPSNFSALISRIKERIRPFKANVPYQDLDLISFIPVLREELDDLTRDFPCKTSMSRFHYRTPLGSAIGIQEDAKNILIGNSATYTNNHLDAFELLAKVDIENSKIVLPLSYGAAGELYSRELIKVAKAKWNDAVFPLLDFMSLEEYNGILSQCKVAIFPILRQQGVFNLHTMVFSGTKVFLPAENPLFKFYRSIGVAVYPLSSLRDADSTALAKLEPSIAANNKRLLLEYFSVENVKLRGEAFLKEIEESLLV